MIDESCREIIEALELNLFVETGTDMAETVALVSGWFSQIDPDFGRISEYVTTGERTRKRGSEPIKYPVFEDVGDSRYKLYTVDVDNYSSGNAAKLFDSNGNIRVIHESSPEFLKRFVGEDICKKSNSIFFLDAHWGKYWPLRDELEKLLTLDKTVIVIDDFFVPGRSNRARPQADFAYDFYYGRILDWGYIYDLFKNVDVKVYYPERSNRDGRGFILIFKGYRVEELGFLNDIPFSYMDSDDPGHREATPFSAFAYLNLSYLARKLVPVSILRLVIRNLQKFMHRFHYSKTI